MESYNYSYSASTSSPLVTIISLIIVLVVLVAVWKIFTKCGEPGWKAIIPFYNLYTEYKLFWGKGWIFILTLIPVVNIVVTIMMLHKMAKAFGHGAGYTLGLLFFPYIFFIILGFNKDEYLGPQ